MKSLLLLMGVVLLAAMPQVCAANAWATTATQVAFSLDLAKATSPNIVSLQGAEDLPGVEELFKDAKMKQLQQSGVQNKAKLWFVLNIPVRVYAMGRDATRALAPAHYVREMKVTVYLLFRKPSSGSSSSGGGAVKYNMVKKEITYVDIPMDETPLSGDGREMGQASFNVAVFIPRSTACILTDSFKAPEPQIRKALVGYAVEATFNGEPCSDFTSSNAPKLGPGETRNSKIFEKAVQSQFSSKAWWKSRSRNNYDEPDVDVCSIAESPYASFYSRCYPRVKPAYGSAAAEVSSSADSAMGSSTSPASVPSSSTGRRSSGKGSSSPETSDSTSSSSSADYDSPL